MQRGRRAVRGRVQTIGLVFHDRGEKRSLVGKIVMHQRAGHPGTFGYLVDSDLVVGSLSKDFCPQSEHLRAAS
jgi:hypothetical protein